jgi:hypothetical protein
MYIHKFIVGIYGSWAFLYLLRGRLHREVSQPVWRSADGGSIDAAVHVCKLSGCVGANRIFLIGRITERQIVLELVYRLLYLTVLYFLVSKQDEVGGRRQARPYLSKDFSGIE